MRLVSFFLAVPDLWPLVPEVGKVWAIVGIILSKYLGELKNVKHIATFVFFFFLLFFPFPFRPPWEGRRSVKKVDL